MAVMRKSSELGLLFRLLASNIELRWAEFFSKRKFINEF